MATTLAIANLTPEQWDFDFYKEYGNSNRFARYMANSPNAVIHVREDLARDPGEKITFPLIRRLEKKGVTGNTTLRGNEEKLDQRSAFVIADFARHAVGTDKKQKKLTGVNLREAMRWALRQWAGDRLIDKVILEGLMAIPIANGVVKTYADASEAERDAWLADNADRVLFGATMANNSGNDHSASLANLDTTADKLSAAVLDLAKYMAKKADPRIMPLRTEADEKFYVVFVGSATMKNLREDATIRQAQREALGRGKENPLFTGGDILWNNMLVHEVEEIPTLAGVGNGGADVEPFFLCGAQALCYGVGQRMLTIEQKDDYDFTQGLAIELMDGMTKTVFGKGASDRDDPVQHGMVTGYVAVLV